MSDTDDVREALWEIIATVRDSAPRRTDDVDTWEIVDALLGSDVLAQIRAEARAEGWDARDKARPQYLGPDDGHYADECMGWEDCYCGTYPNPYRAEGSA